MTASCDPTTSVTQNPPVHDEVIVQGVTDGYGTRRYSWAVHPSKEVLLSSLRKPTSIFGRVIDVEPISRKDKFLRKKYMVLWRPEHDEAIPYEDHEFASWSPALNYQQELGNNCLQQDCNLQSPMHYFPGNFSIIEISMASFVVPKMLASALSGKKIISFAGCFSHLYFHFSLAATELILFAIMSCDRYMPISKPLRYPTIMMGRVCSQLVLGTWVGGLVMVLPSVVLKARLLYCGPNVIDHYFCDNAPLLHLACTDTWLVELNSFVVSFVLLLGSLALSARSYSWIISTMVRIPSAQGRQKAFATCASHFTVVSVGFGICIFIYTRLYQRDARHLNGILSVLSSIVTPLLNPFVLSLRNEQVKEALKNASCRLLGMIKWFRPSSVHLTVHLSSLYFISWSIRMRTSSYEDIVEN
ncbi:olfactory receptor 6C4-like [Gavia stellata]|uniref:olfactory receptor 6C4-like n=1 Tax=Gavia stellata TaxID=37040 RepID=UPI00289B92E1|nr:olfactory receptor 6C4-like [Gavia stellata]